MLQQVAEGVLVHESEFIQSNSVVVQGRDGALLIDPGITGDEMAALANDLRELGQPVVAGFSTHPDWDHVLWHPNFGEAPRYGTARCAASMRDLLSNADWRDRVAEGLPPEYAEDIPMDLLGHGSVGGAEQLQARIEQDRAYVQDLLDGGVPDDPWVGPSAPLECCPTCIDGNSSGSPKKRSSVRERSSKTSVKSLRANLE